MGRRLIIIFLVLVIVIIVASIVCLLLGGLAWFALEEADSGGYDPLSQAVDIPTVGAPPTLEPVEMVDISPGEPDTWLVMLYQDADDDVLEEDIFLDLNEAELAGSSENVTIVSQFDRYRGAFSGDGDWTGAKRFLVTQDTNLSALGSQVLMDLGEVDMSEKETLVDFVIWAMQSYPAENYALIMSDHGMGWPGGWSDPDPYQDGEMELHELVEGLRLITAKTGIGQLEFVGFDACLMSQVEVMTAIAPYAKYAVASEETEPAMGWAYKDFLLELSRNPSMSGGDMARLIVETYIDQDVKIQDAQQRAEFVEMMWGSSQSASASQLAAAMIQDSTLTAVDLSGTAELNTALNDLAYKLTGIDQNIVARARSYAQSYTDPFDQEGVYIDLGHFAILVAQESGDVVVAEAATTLVRAIEKAVIAERHGDRKPGSTGFSIYFPNSRLYKDTLDPTWTPYTLFARDFAYVSLWDDFLAYHYTGLTFEPGAVVAVSPEQDTQITAPGKGDITIDPITISASQIDVEGVVTLNTSIHGDNIGYVYLIDSYWYEDFDSYLQSNMDFIGADETLEIGGVYYPDWGDEAVIEMEVDWEPTIYYMTDGVLEEFALFEPAIYGLVEEDDLYSVQGEYIFADSGERLDAVMYFDSDGIMMSIFGFTGEEGFGAPHAITPRIGDQFVITESWLDFADTPEGEWNEYEGGTLTFGEEPFTWEVYYGFEGEYSVGILVEDLDGNIYSAFVEITVTE
jgi:hypothetical protein